MELKHRNHSVMRSIRTTATFFSRSIRRLLQTSAALLILIALSGCLPTERVVWSPDGRQAVVIGEQGLYLSDEDGNLSGLLLENVRLACWFADSRRLLLSGVREVASWEALAEHLPPERNKILTAAADEAWRRLRAGEAWESIMVDIGKGRHFGDEDKKAMQMYLLHRHGLEAADKISLKPEQAAELHVDQCYLFVAKLDNGEITPGRILMGDVLIPIDLRLSTNAQAAVYTILPDGDQIPQMFVVSLHDDSITKLVDGPVALYPDWTPDGRSLVYIRATSHESPDDDMQLGHLVRRKVLDDEDGIDLSQGTEELAGLLFYVTSRVRCLRDGRILFSSFNAELPMAMDDLNEAQEIYAMHPGREATLRRIIPKSQRAKLPDDLSMFTVSPDETRLAVAGQESSVSVVDLATGEVETIQEPLDEDADLRTVPTWKGEDQLCFAGVDPEAREEEGEQTRLHILSRAGDETKLLSRDWPEAVWDGWLD